MCSTCVSQRWLFKQWLCQGSPQCTFVVSLLSGRKVGQRTWNQPQNGSDLTDPLTCAGVAGALADAVQRLQSLGAEVDQVRVSSPGIAVLLASAVDLLGSTRVIVIDEFPRS